RGQTRMSSRRGSMGGRQRRSGGAGTQALIQPVEKAGIVELRGDRNAPEAWIVAILAFYGVFVGEKNDIGIQAGKRVAGKTGVVGQGTAVCQDDSRCTQGLEKSLWLADAGYRRDATMSRERREGGLCAVGQSY